MKPADAKTPKFDSAWWKANKSPLADITGKFADALKAYETAKKKVGGVATKSGDAMAVGKALDTIVKLAKSNKTDPKLTAKQKETKEAFASYERLAGAALAPFLVMAKDRDFAACLSSDAAPAIEDMVKRQSKRLEAHCKKEFSPENYEFLVLMSTGVTNKKVYERYIAEDGTKQVNISSATRGKFEKEAANGEQARWDAAPWPEAKKEVVALMKGDTFVRFKTGLVKEAFPALP